MKLAEAQAVVNTECGKLKHHGRAVHFASCMDLCHLKHAELAEHLQKYKGRIVLQWANVSDGTGYKAVFAEQGASASQVAAAIFLDTKTRLLGMAGEANDAVSAYTQVHLSEAPRLLR